MKKIKLPLIVFAVGMLLLAGSTVGATRAVLQDYSNQQFLQFNTSALRVDLQEEQNGEYVSVEGEDTLKFTSIDPKSIHGGQTYPEKVRVVNKSYNKRTGEQHEEYVRVTVKKSWTNADKTKDTLLDPDLIELGIEDGWVECEDQRTREQRVYYLTAPLKGEGTKDFLKSITINDKVFQKVETKDYEENGIKIDGTIINEYEYNGKAFYIEIKVDAIQTHHPEDAMGESWGVHVKVDDNGNITKIGK